MTNPFDSNFFKFLGGFTLIIGMSFVVLFITQKFVDDSVNDNISASILDYKK